MGLDPPDHTQPLGVLPPGNTLVELDMELCDDRGVLWRGIARHRIDRSRRIEGFMQPTASEGMKRSALSLRPRLVIAENGTAYLAVNHAYGTLHGRIEWCTFAVRGVVLRNGEVMGQSESLLIDAALDYNNMCTGPRRSPPRVVIALMELTQLPENPESHHRWELRLIPDASLAMTDCSGWNDGRDSYWNGELSVPLDVEFIRSEWELWR